MFTIFLRRLQKYSIWIKLTSLLSCVVGLGWVIFYTTPELLNIILASILLLLVLSILLSLFLNSRLSLIVSIGVTFLLFLKAVELISGLNLSLLGGFLLLLWLYLRPETIRKTASTESQTTLSTKPVFPKGWIFGVGKKKKV